MRSTPSAFSALATRCPPEITVLGVVGHGEVLSLRRGWERLSRYIAYSRRILYEACYPASGGWCPGGVRHFRGRGSLPGRHGSRESLWICTSTRQGNSSQEHGIAVPEAEVDRRARGGARDARRLGGRVVVKAQVKTGGRGKAGGVKIAADPAAAELTARQILGMDIKGHTVGTVMLAQPVDIEAEFYVSYVLDRAAGTFLAIASAEGGMEIEEVAATRPEAVARIPIDPAEGVTTAKAARDRRGGRAAAADRAPSSCALWQVLVREDALLVEVNPLVRTTEGRILALDGKVTLDDNARFRQARWGADDTDARRPAGGGGRRQGPQLRQARRRGRHHRQRRRTGHVHPRRGRRLRRAPRQLPRHRRRRVRPGHGRRPVGHPLRPGREVRVRQRLRRHHRLRRGRRRHRAGPGLRPADQTARRPPRRQQRRPRAGRSSTSTRIRWSSRSPPWTAPPRRAAELADARPEEREAWRSSSPRRARSSSRA